MDKHNPGTFFFDFLCQFKVGFRQFRVRINEKYNFLVRGELVSDLRMGNDVS